MIHFIKNTSLTLLADDLILRLKDKKNFFIASKIIFPNRNLETWFKTYWLSKEESVLMNVEFFSLEKGITNLLRFKKIGNVIGELDLSNIILKIILDNIDNEVLNIPITIKSYIYDDVENKKVNDLRLYDLSNQLAKLFLEYEYDLFSPSGWQKDLLDLIYQYFDTTEYGTLKYYVDNGIFIKEEEPIYFFGFISYDHLKPLFESAIKGLSYENNTYYFSLEEDRNYVDKHKVNIIASPSKLREIEWLHSEVCHLILSHKDIKLSDIVVLAKDISSYETIIKRVFKQDDLLFPSIPYVIRGNKSKQGDISNALNTLFNIVDKGFYTRLDVFNLINLSTVKKARNLSDDEVDKFIELFVRQNIYRSRNGSDDWDYIKKRLLLSKVSDINLDDPLVELSDDSYLPYSSISFDDEMILKLIAIIDDINSFMSIMNDFSFITNDKIELIRNNLNKWFSYSSLDEVETNKNYKNIIAFLNKFETLNLYSPHYSYDMFKYHLLDLSKETSSSKGETFLGGVSFLNFKEGVIYDNKYVFFLGLNSLILPSKVVKNENDLRNKKDDLPLLEKKTFYLQYQNAKERFYLSYINKDLTTDEELYKSTLLLDLQEHLSMKDEEIVSLPLDETRLWKDVFTRRGFRNKNHFTNLFEDDVTNIHSIETPTHELRNKVSISEITSFLKEPYQYKYLYLFGREKQHLKEVKEEYENISIDSLTGTEITKMLILEYLKTRSDDFFITAKDSVFDTLLKERKVIKDLEFIIDSNIKKSINAAKEAGNIIINYSEDDFEIFVPDNVQLTYKNIHNWEITCNREFVRSIKDNKRYYFELKHLIKENNISDYVNLYVASLIDIASLNNNEEINVYLYKMGTPKTYKVTPNAAKELLNKIFEGMNDFNNIFYAGLDLKTQKISTLFDLKDKLLGDDFDTGWKYFDEKKDINILKNIGYNADTFTVDDLIYNIEKMKAFILFIKKPEEGEEDNV